MMAARRKASNWIGWCRLTCCRWVKRWRKPGRNGGAPEDICPLKCATTVASQSSAAEHISLSGEKSWKVGRKRALHPFSYSFSFLLKKTKQPSQNCFLCIWIILNFVWSSKTLSLTRYLSYDTQKGPTHSSCIRVDQFQILEVAWFDKRAGLSIGVEIKLDTLTIYRWSFGKKTVFRVVLYL